MRNPHTHSHTHPYCPIATTASTVSTLSLTLSLSLPKWLRSVLERLRHDCTNRVTLMAEHMYAEIAVLPDRPPLTAGGRGARAIHCAATTAHRVATRTHYNFPRHRQMRVRGCCWQISNWHFDRDLLYKCWCRDVLRYSECRLSGGSCCVNEAVYTTSNYIPVHSKCIYILYLVKIIVITTNITIQY